jgi:hypothetical protein
MLGCNVDDVIGRVEGEEARLFDQRLVFADRVAGVVEYESENLEPC